MAPDPWWECHRDVLGDDWEPFAAATRPSNSQHGRDLTIWPLHRRLDALRAASFPGPASRGLQLRAVGTPVSGHDVSGTGWRSLTDFACHALTVAWFHKWNVHRYLRPEEYFGLLHVSDAGALKFPVPRFLRQSEALGIIARTTGTCLLPQAYPEGSPIHPSYPAGHAVVAGACGTILKFFFNAAMRLPAAVESWRRDR